MDDQSNKEDNDVSSHPSLSSSNRQGTLAYIPSNDDTTEEENENEDNNEESLQNSTPTMTNMLAPSTTFQLERLRSSDTLSFMNSSKEKLLSLRSRLQTLFSEHSKLQGKSKNKIQVLERTSPGFQAILLHSGYGSVSQAQALRIFDALFEERPYVTFEELEKGLARSRRFRRFTLEQTADLNHEFQVDIPTSDKPIKTIDLYSDPKGELISKERHIRISKKRWDFYRRILRSKCLLISGDVGVRWIIFTNGKPYSGKNHVVHYMSEAGIIPLEHFVTINVDSTLRLLPEWQVYEQKFGPERAREACMDEAEILKEYMLKYSITEFQNIWMDSPDLLDHDYLREFRTKYLSDKEKQEYKLCIIHVFASEENIKQRMALAKGNNTGTVLDFLQPSPSSSDRRIEYQTSNPDTPRSLVPRHSSGEGMESGKLKRLSSNKHSVIKSKLSVSSDPQFVDDMLKISQVARESRFDLCVFVDNDQQTPQLAKVEDYSPSWQCTLGRHFGNIKEQSNGFPAALPILNLDRTILGELIERNLIAFEVKEEGNEYVSPVDGNQRSASDSSFNSEVFDAQGDNNALTRQGTQNDLYFFRNGSDMSMSSGSTASHHPQHLSTSIAHVMHESIQTSSILMTGNQRANHITMTFQESQFYEDKSQSSPKSANVFGNKRSLTFPQFRQESSDSSGSGSTKSNSLERASKRQKAEREKHVLITACSPFHDQARLPKARKEAMAIEKCIEDPKLSGYSGYKYRSRVPLDCSPEKLREELQGKDCWHIVAHTDFPLYNEFTVAFVNASNNICAVPQETLVSLVQTMSKNNGGSLEMIFLNGCKGEQLAKRFVHDCKIPHVVFWKSIVDDEAAFNFGIFYWQAILRGATYEGALHEAQTDVVLKIPQRYPSGHSMEELPTQVPKFIMQVDPDEPNQVKVVNNVRFYAPDLEHSGDRIKVQPRRPAGVVSYLSLDEIQTEVKSSLRVLITLKVTNWEDIVEPEASALLDVIDAVFKGSVELFMSPVSPVNLDRPSRERAGIPAEAAYFSWLYPFKETETVTLKKCFEKMKSLELEKSNPELELLWVGAYIYFNSAGKVVAANAVSSNLESHQGDSLDFFPPEILPDEDAIVLKERGRWFPVTIPSMIEAGARYFAWILPREVLRTRTYPAYGSFAYLFCDLGFDKKKGNEEARELKNLFFGVKPKAN